MRHHLTALSWQTQFECTAYLRMVQCTTRGVISRKMWLRFRYAQDLIDDVGGCFRQIGNYSNVCRDKPIGKQVHEYIIAELLVVDMSWKYRMMSYLNGLQHGITLYGDGDFEYSWCDMYHGCLYRGHNQNGISTRLVVYDRNVSICEMLGVLQPIR